jgi:hypothetical protein
MAKFMQSLNPGVYAELESLAQERDITIQELFRSIIIPEWLKLQTAPTARKNQADLDEFAGKNRK